MPDIEKDFTKVVLGLNAHAQGCGKRTELCDAYDCPYREDANNCDIEQMCIDALAVVKKMREHIAMLKTIYGTDVEIVGEVVRCKDCDKAYVLSNHVICSNLRNTECQSYPLDWFCADGERKTDDE